MAEVIRMPKMSDTMEEGVIAAWSVKVGDSVKSGDILAEVETDKATMDMESYYTGTVLYIGVEKGQAVPIDAIMAVIGKPGEDFSALLEGGASAAPAKTESPIVVIETAIAPAVVSPKIDTSNIKATLITMPLLSDTMTEGVIHNWLFKVGDKVKSGDMLAEIETDKATMEIEAYESGILLYIGVEAGQAAPVNSVIAVIGEAGADYKALLNAQGSVAAAPVANASHAVEAPVQVNIPSPVAPVSTSAPLENSNGRILASPLAKSLAKEKGIALDQVRGSGESGRIVKSDIDNFKASAPVAAVNIGGAASVATPVGIESTEVIAPSQMRKAISKGLTRNKFTAPEFFLTMEINMDKAMAARTAMNEVSPVKISFNDMVIKACAAALRKHPNVNSSWKEDKILKYGHIHIGMAVAIEDGLVVPVIRFADTLPLSQIAATTKDLGGKAKNKQLQPKDWEGNTFTVSNLGMFGIDEFTSIINNPDNEACILAVGGIKEIVAHKNGTFYPTNVMKVTLTCDHRVVDGASGAAFLVTLKEFLEEPYRMLV
jgi:pyruvate dehydrogenase E2 component (dihydrolipoamide acetyltransferase)